MNHPSSFAPEILMVAISLGATLHILLRRRNPYAALWWICLVWLLPCIGALLYYFFGINRIERRATWLRRHVISRSEESPHLILTDSIDENAISFEMRHLVSVCRVVENVVKLPLTRGNRITPLVGGDDAFTAMLEAIDAAEKSIGLSTYIFEYDAIGQKFIAALSKAVARGVRVRVLIDDVGSGWHWKSVHHELERQKVPVSYFMPTLVPWRLAYFNLRSHRKILTIDGKVAFTGGMNITASHSAKSLPSNPAEDVHFRLEGPVVAHVQEAFRADWHFSTEEILGGEAWFPNLYEVGLTYARGIADGPDEDFEKCKLTMLGALAHAKRSVRIMTPYLIPDAAMISSINLAALSGVQVDLVLPDENDMALVGWATQAYLWEFLQRGVRVWRTPPPFNHAKLMVVDGGWTLFGSTNWDPRSLRLNFEFNVECYGRELALSIEEFIDSKIRTAHKITLAEMDFRPFPIKLRDGVARLFSPML